MQPKSLSEVFQEAYEEALNMYGEAFEFEDDKEREYLFTLFKNTLQSCHTSFDATLLMLSMAKHLEDFTNIMTAKMKQPEYLAELQGIIRSYHSEQQKTFVKGEHSAGSEAHTFTDDFNQKLVNVHDEEECKGRNCVIHNPSDHHMREWRLHWRQDRQLMERICPHGIGHPDPDDLRYQVEYLEKHEAGTHSCDGCCAPPE